MGALKDTSDKISSDIRKASDADLVAFDKFYRRELEDWNNQAGKWTKPQDRWFMDLYIQGFIACIEAERQRRVEEIAAAKAKREAIPELPAKKPSPHQIQAMRSLAGKLRVIKKTVEADDLDDFASKLHGAYGFRPESALSQAELFSISANAFLRLKRYEALLPPMELSEAEKKAKEIKDWVDKRTNPKRWCKEHQMPRGKPNPNPPHTPIPYFNNGCASCPTELDILRVERKSLADWKDAWFVMRNAAGRAYWKKPLPAPPPNIRAIINRTKALIGKPLVKGEYNGWREPTSAQLRQLEYLEGLAKQYGQ